MSSQVETSQESNPEIPRFRSESQNPFMRTASEIADHSARRIEYLECRTESWRADPCRARMHNRSTFQDRKRHRHALCRPLQKRPDAPCRNQLLRSIARRLSELLIGCKPPNLAR